MFTEVDAHTQLSHVCQFSSRSRYAMRELLDRTPVIDVVQVEFVTQNGTVTSSSEYDNEMIVEALKKRYPINLVVMFNEVEEINY